MIKANFNTYNNYVTDSLYQWDLNRVLVISGLNLLTAPEIHFANANMDRAIVRQSTLDSGVVTAHIPNSLLQAPLTIKAYVGIYEGETFKVIETIEIPVIAKAKPADYVIEDSDEEIYSFKALENDIANARKDMSDKCDTIRVEMLADVEKTTTVLSARVDNIIAHNNNTEGNTELVDIRTGYDGTVYDSAGDAVRSQIGNLNERVVQTKGYSDTSVMSQKAVTEALNGVLTNNELLREYDTKKVNGTTIILSEREPRNITDLTAQRATLYGVNHFDLENADFIANSYNGYHSLTKENGGIKVVCTVTDSSAYLMESTSFTAHITGLLYCSCEADCDGDIKDVIFLVKVNGEKHTMCYGKGLLYQAVDVTKGDNIELCFYTHVGTSVGNTLYYKNIQCAYDGLYNYTPYSLPITNSIIRKTLVLPAVFDDWYTDITHPDTGGLYRFTMNDSVSMAEYPANNDIIPQHVKVLGANLVSYNEVYNGVEGVGIATNGRVSLFLSSVQSRYDLPAYLERNPISIIYEPTEGAETYINFENSDLRQGKVIELETAQDVTYYHKPTIEKKYTCVCFGDSITGMFADKTDYPSMIERDTDLTCLNVGFGGSQLTDHSDVNYQPFSMNRLVDAVVSGDFSTQDAKATTVGGLYPAHLATLKAIDFSAVDFVTLFFGTNDWGNGTSSLKSADDTATENKQRTNVEDALKYSINKLLTTYPHLRIIVISPYWRSVSSGKDSDINANNRGVYLYEYADYIQKVTEETYHLPTINLYRTSGVNAITNRYFTSDGTHPTERMKRIIANKIINKIAENR